jgi:class 3 adenylate cyclase
MPTVADLVVDVRDVAVHRRVAAAHIVQMALISENWPTVEPVRVRIALRTGETGQSDEDYYGRTINGCARIRSIAHGGQVRLSGIAANLTSSILPEGARVRDLGEHQLKRPRRT